MGWPTVAVRRKAIREREIDRRGPRPPGPANDNVPRHRPGRPANDNDPWPEPPANPNARERAIRRATRLLEEVGDIADVLPISTPVKTAIEIATTVSRTRLAPGTFPPKGTVVGSWRLYGGPFPQSSYAAGYVSWRTTRQADAKFTNPLSGQALAGNPVAGTPIPSTWISLSVFPWENANRRWALESSWERVAPNGDPNVHPYTSIAEGVLVSTIATPIPTPGYTYSVQGQPSSGLVPRSGWQTSVTPEAVTGAARGHRRLPPGEGVKERKGIANPRAGSWVGWAISLVTDGLEIIDAFHSALPKHLQAKGDGWSRPSPQQMLEALYRNWHKVQINKALINLIENIVEDALIGRLGKAAQDQARDLLNRLGRPVGWATGPAF